MVKVKRVFTKDDPKLDRNYVESDPMDLDDLHDYVMLKLVNDKKYKELQKFVDTHEINNGYVNREYGFNALHAAIWIDDLKSTIILLKKGMLSDDRYSCLESGKSPINIIILAMFKNSINVLKSSFVRSSLNYYYSGKYGANDYMMFNVLLMEVSPEVKALTFDIVRQELYDKMDNNFYCLRNKGEYTWLELAVYTKEWKFAEVFLEHNIANVKPLFYTGKCDSDHILFAIFDSKAPLYILNKMITIKNLYPNNLDALCVILKSILKLFKHDYPSSDLMYILQTFLDISGMIKNDNLDQDMLRNIYNMAINSNTYELCRLAINNGLNINTRDRIELLRTNNIKIVQLLFMNGVKFALYDSKLVKTLIKKFGDILTWIPESYTFSVDDLVIIILVQYYYGYELSGIDLWKKYNYNIDSIKITDDEKSKQVIFALLFKNGVHVDHKYLPSADLLIRTHTIKNEDKLIDTLQTIAHLDQKFKLCDDSTFCEAVSEKFNKVVEFLLQNGSDPNIQLVEGIHKNLTPLAVAICTNNIPLFNLLKKWKAKVETKSSNVLTDVMVANISTQSKKHIICSLIMNNADINKSNEEGNTALNLAIQREYTNIRNMLIECNADPTIKNNEGKTALDLSNDSLYTSTRKKISKYYRKWVGCGSIKPAAAR